MYLVHSKIALRALPLEAVNMAAPNPDGPARFITTKEGARLLGVSARTMEAWREETMRARQQGSLGQDSFIGPPYVKYSRKLVRYRIDKLLKWAARQRVRGNRNISKLNSHYGEPSQTKGLSG
jgi:hypothetical protein